MADDLSVAFDRLRTSSSRLNQICDVAAQAVREIESFLEEMHVGLAASVMYKQTPLDAEGLHTTDHFIGYFRTSPGKFRISVVSVPPGPDGLNDADVRPWAECNRDDKLESFEKLPELLVRLAENVEERITKADFTVTTVTAALPPTKKRKGG